MHLQYQTLMRSYQQRTWMNRKLQIKLKKEWAPLRPKTPWSHHWKQPQPSSKSNRSSSLNHRVLLVSLTLLLAHLPPKLLTKLLLQSKRERKQLPITDQNWKLSKKFLTTQIITQAMPMRQMIRIGSLLVMKMTMSITWLRRRSLSVRTVWWCMRCILITM